jgi:hypothetical protein
VAGLVAVGVGGAPLLAQPDEAPAPAANLSAAEMLAQAETMQSELEKDLKFVIHLRELTRKQQDVIKLSCVNEKYMVLKAKANIFDRTHDELKDHVSDPTASAHSFEELSSASAAAHAARLEAEACVGETELSKESTNTVDHPPFPDDPTLGDPFRPDLEPPGYASPFN